MKIKNMIICISLGLIIIVMGAVLLFKNPDAFSTAERRTLATRPELSVEKITSGKYMSEVEKYGLDQFPLRDLFRSVKAYSEYHIFNKLDNNGIYKKDGYLSKLEYPLNTDMLDYAASKFDGIYDKYLSDKQIKPYMVIVPDKNYYLTQNSNMLALDYDELYSYMTEKTPYMTQIDIRDCLSIEDYYYTDTHWRQECITDVADKILAEMGSDESCGFNGDEALSVDTPFNGVYVGQSALVVEPDQIKYLNSDILDNCIVTNLDTGKPVPMQVYDFDKAKGNDGYDFFLSGASALIEIENPNAKTDKELVIFRDSYGSSLTPLLVSNYSKITLVDIRYMQSGMVGAFIDFDNQDVLFEYSTMLLNNSLALK